MIRQTTVVLCTALSAWCCAAALVQASDPETAKTITNSIGMKLRLIPAGEFVMGSPESDPRRYTNQLQHRVRITKSFYLGVHEVTVGQFRRFVTAADFRTAAEQDGKGGVGWNESKGAFQEDARFTWRTPGFVQTDDHPVTNVSWNDAAAFCRWLSAVEGKRYGLPTEAQWEYACRAGTTTRYWCGDDPEGLATVANVADGTAKAKYPQWATIEAKDGFVFTAPVGRYQPNPFGLCDMHGNVWEWCADWFDKEYYKQSPRDDPAGPTVGSNRVNRGGGWINDAWECGAANRGWDIPSNRIVNLGFRVALQPPGQ